jgi:hypothetical protein
MPRSACPLARPRYGIAVLRIIHRRRIVRPKIEHVVSAPAQNLCDAVFVIVACVVGANGNSHGLSDIKGEGGLGRAVERPTPMKLACASGLLHRAIEHGELTQLEFLDLCAREFACDGVVLDVRHFPRTDDDYLAQVKKMATDRGLCLAALADAAFFLSDGEHMRSILSERFHWRAFGRRHWHAKADCSWSDQLERLGVATVSPRPRT